MSEIKNLAASVRTRLKNVADTEHKNFDFILILYMMERFMFRLSVSRFSNNFILKGGLLLYICMQEKARPTKDVDFLAKHIENDMDEIKKAFIEICLTEAKDALVFEIDSIIA